MSGPDEQQPDPHRPGPSEMDQPAEGGDLPELDDDRRVADIPAADDRGETRMDGDTEDISDDMRQ